MHKLQNELRKHNTLFAVILLWIILRRVEGFLKKGKLEYDIAVKAHTKNDTARRSLLSPSPFPPSQHHRPFKRFRNGLFFSLHKKLNIVRL